MVLYDPSRDLVEAKDIPCTLSLQWLAREGRLHLTVMMRSNDVMWGFSGINSFEWSVLQELMSFWVGMQPGELTFVAGSFHLYGYHEQRARNISADFRNITAYAHGLKSPVLSTPYDIFDRKLDEWFALEAESRADPDKPIPANTIPDAFLDLSLRLVRIHHGVNSHWPSERLATELAALPATDLTAAAYEFYLRTYPEIIRSAIHPTISAFIREFRSPSPLR